MFNSLPPTAEALTCTIPVSLRPWLKAPREVVNGLVGTYFDATRVRFTRANRVPRDSSWTDVWAGAHRASSSLDDYLRNLSPSGEPCTSVAALKAIPDVFIIFKSMIGKPRDAAFEVTNVGRFSPFTTKKTGDSPRWQLGKVPLSRSSVVSGAAITVSVATGGNGSLAIGFSWQEGVVENEVIDNIRDDVGKFFEKYQ